MTIKGNKIAKFDEVVEETQLNSNAAELVTDGFIELVTDGTKSKAAVKTENQETQLDPATEALKSDYLAAVKAKADLPKETKPADLAKAGQVIADLKAELVKVGVEFDENGDIVNPPAKN